jgi:hypothetical protein
VVDHFVTSVGQPLRDTALEFPPGVIRPKMDSHLSPPHRMSSDVRGGDLVAGQLGDSLRRETEL